MAGGDELKLLGTWPSPFVARVEIALRLKGLSYEYVEQDLTNKSELLLSSNPVHKKVPVLIHNGKAISESPVILQYVDEAFGGASLLSADPYERAVARFWAAYIDDELITAWVPTILCKTEEEKAEAIKKTLAAMERLEGALKDSSKGKPFFGGETVGLVDVVLGGLNSWMKATEELIGVKIFDPAKTPLLAAWVEHFDELDAVRDVSPDVDGVIKYAKMRQLEAAAGASEN
uniref:glutathione transferase n=3 Tax=Oryza brachyantha TaxID=4533 RepID=J3N4A5_ORYBR